MSDELNFILSEDYTELRVSILKQYRDALNEMLERPIDDDANNILLQCFVSIGARMHDLAGIREEKNILCTDFMRIIMNACYQQANYYNNILEDVAREKDEEE